MVTLLLARTLNCRQLSVAMRWARKAGLEAVGGRYAFSPGKPSGHYGRHLKLLLGPQDKCEWQYEVDIPGHQKLDLAKTVHRTPTLRPHQSIAEATMPEYVQEAKEAMALGQMPAA